MEPRDLQRLAHILDYCDDIGRYIAAAGADREAFLRDSMLQHSIAFCILQIGELAGKISAALRAETEGELPWSAIRGMRNVVAHDYGNVDLETVWEAATKDIPELKAFCEARLNDAEQ